VTHTTFQKLLLTPYTLHKILRFWTLEKHFCIKKSLKTCFVRGLGPCLELWISTAIVEGGETVGSTVCRSCQVGHGLPSLAAADPGNAISLSSRSHWRSLRHRTRNSKIRPNTPSCSGIPLSLSQQPISLVVSVIRTICAIISLISHSSCLTELTDVRKAHTGSIFIFF